MIILHFHLQPQFKYELFHIYFTLFVFMVMQIKLVDGVITMTVRSPLPFVWTEPVVHLDLGADKLVGNR